MAHDVNMLIEPTGMRTFLELFYQKLKTLIRWAFSFRKVLVLNKGKQKHVQKISAHAQLNDFEVILFAERKPAFHTSTRKP